MVKVLLPLSTQHEPSFTALVRVPAASEPGFRFGQRPAADPFAGGELRNVLAPLLVAAGDINVIGAERIVRGDDQADGGIDARQFFDDDGVLDVAEARAAQFLGEDGAQEAQLAGFFDDVERKDLLFVPLEDVRADFLLGKFADALAKLDLLRREVKFHGRKGGVPDSMLASLNGSNPPGDR